MAVNLEDLINFNLLTYYDENIKKYIFNKMANMPNSVRFTPVGDLPVEGKGDVLYVTDEGLKTWNPDKKKYEGISGGGIQSTLSTAEILKILEG